MYLRMTFIQVQRIKIHSNNKNIPLIVSIHNFVNIMLYYISSILFLYPDFICKHVNFCSDPFSPESVRFLKKSKIAAEENYSGESNVYSEEGISLYVYVYLASKLFLLRYQLTFFSVDFLFQASTLVTQYWKASYLTNTIDRQSMVLIFRSW